ncbi:MAG: PQQ-like beta-propeller repeat protein [Planctomycetes bacterium]|nr:PQQ-like beta-propeller repeat protein [Planctomycetota bacterium]
MNAIRTLSVLVVASLLARAAEPTVIWSVDVKGDQVETPVVVDGTVYAVARETPPPDGGSPGWIFAIDASSGKVRWSSSLKSPRIRAAVDGGVVCVLDGDVLLDGDTTNIRAFDADSGKELWTASASGPEGTYFTPIPPAAAGGHLYFARGRSVVALDVTSGKELWVKETPGRPVQFLPVGERVWTAVVDDQSKNGADPSRTLALDAATGKEDFRRDGAWRTSAGCGIVVLEGNGTMEALDPVSLKSKWTVKAKSTWETALEDGLVQFIGKDDKVHGLDVATGKETRTTPVAGQLGGGRVIRVNDRGEAIAHAANDGSELWTWKAPARPVSQFALKASLLCVGCADRKVYALREPGGK